MRHDLDVAPEALARLRSAATGPLVLVNLVRLRPGGGDAYRRYGEAVAPLLARHGAEVLYAGPALAALIGGRWDFAAVTRYPDVSALEALVGDPEFVAAAPLRHEALAAGILHAFAP